jgi:hypothetical protein
MKPKCGAKGKTTGNPCRNPAGFKTDHVGAGRCHLHGGGTPDGKKYARRQMAAAAASAFGLPIDVSPDEALTQELARCAGAVHYLAGHLRAIEPAERLAPAHAGFVALYDGERDRLVRVAKAALDAGVAERQVAAIERTAEAFARVLRRVLADLDVLDDPRAPLVVQRHLALLEASHDG